MRRLVTVGVAAALLPLAAWQLTSAARAAPASPTTTTINDDVVATTAAATTTSVDPSGAAPPPTTTAPDESPPTTLSGEPPPTTVEVPPTEPPMTDPPTTDTKPVDSTPDTTVPQEPPDTTVPEDSTPDTTVPEEPPPTTEPEEPPPTTDPETEPTAPPVTPDGGRIVIPDGSVETGQTRQITFPVAGPTNYGNDFGDCRDGCRRAHQGNDIIGVRLQPLLAMHDGVVDHLINHPTAGFGIAIRDADGWQYHVYHVNNDSPGSDDGIDDGTWRFAPGIVAGAPVQAGQLIGWMGDSGNSEGSVPHAHVEIHKPDGSAINPFWSLRLAQRDVNCAVVTPDPVEPIDPTATSQPTDDTTPGTTIPVQAVDVAPETTAPPSTTPDSSVPDSSVPASTVPADTAPEPADVAWLDKGWSKVELPAGWHVVEPTEGTADGESARMWISRDGFTPVDAAAVKVGAARYDEGVDCMIDQPELGPQIPAEIGRILATIRTLESGGDYTAQAASSTASGAYQFVDATWNNYGGYAKAKNAPPAVQDAKALEHVKGILERNGGDVGSVPVTWYIGHVPVGDEWDSVPAAPGNTLTPREYQSRWLAVYDRLAGGDGLARVTTWEPVDVSCRTVVINVGTTDEPELVLTQAATFEGQPNGLAAVIETDPCDPARHAELPVPPDAPEAIRRRPQRIVAQTPE